MHYAPHITCHKQDTTHNTSRATDHTLHPAPYKLHIKPFALHTAHSAPKCMAPTHYTTHASSCCTPLQPFLPPSCTIAAQVFDDADEEAQEILQADQGPPPDAPFSTRGMEMDYDREWNIRKVSAATLDAMAIYLAGEQLLPSLLPLVEAKLRVG